jgi:hypothetical protein
MLVRVRVKVKVEVRVACLGSPTGRRVFLAHMQEREI